MSELKVIENTIFLKFLIQVNKHNCLLTTFTETKTQEESSASIYTASWCPSGWKKAVLECSKYASHPSQMLVL